VPMAGDVGMEIRPNIFVWVGMSPEFFAAIKQLVEERLVKFGPTQPLVYMIDGQTLNMPLAKRPPARGYAKPHWLPVTFNATKIVVSPPKQQERGGVR
jgi:hypothetical protein